jgi:hypothetical protein
MKAFFGYTLVLMIVCAQICCSPQAAAQTVQITRLALMPLVQGMPPPAPGRHVLDCRETELTTDGQIIDPGAQEVVTRCLQEALEKELSGRVVPQNETAGADGLLAYMKKTETLKKHALKLGAQVQASHILAGTVQRYRQLKGTAYGADRPASVAFSVYLLETATGQIVWSGAFDKTQQSLTENLLDAPAFFKNGAKWLTAQELTRGGAETVAEKLKQATSGPGGK